MATAPLKSSLSHDAPVRRRVAIVAADSKLGHDLSLRALAAGAESAGFDCDVLTFRKPSESEAVIEELLDSSPLAVAIAIPFQTRATELLALALRLRDRGYLGHISVTGDFADGQYQNVLRDYLAVDSVVRVGAEEAFRELCKNLRDCGTARLLPGLIIRGAPGEIRVGSQRLLRLDNLAAPVTVPRQ